MGGSVCRIHSALTDHLGHVMYQRAKQANKLTKHVAPPGALAGDSQQCTPPPHAWGGRQDPGSQSLTQPHLSLQGQSTHSFPLSLCLPFFPLPLFLLLSLHLSGSGSVSSFLHIFLHLQHPTPSPHLQP